MAESVDALVSNTSGAIHPGSIPGLGTERKKKFFRFLFYILMQIYSRYNSPIGKMLLVSDEGGLIGAWFVGQKYYASVLQTSATAGSSMFIDDAARWLNDYFSGVRPNYVPQLSFIGSPFRLKVWKLLLTIPYGQTTSYKALSDAVAAQMSLPQMSAQAVGGAVGHNPISIIVPCHRVLSATGNLTGYAGGLDRKEYLLRLEGAIR